MVPGKEKRKEQFSSQSPWQRPGGGMPRKSQEAIGGSSTMFGRPVRETIIHGRVQAGVAGAPSASSLPASEKSSDLLPSFRLAFSYRWICDSNQRHVDELEMTSFQSGLNTVLETDAVSVPDSHARRRSDMTILRLAQGTVAIEAGLAFSPSTPPSHEPGGPVACSCGAHASLPARTLHELLPHASNRVRPEIGRRRLPQHSSRFAAITLWHGRTSHPPSAPEAEACRLCTSPRRPLGTLARHGLSPTRREMTADSHHRNLPRGWSRF